MKKKPTPTKHLPLLTPLQRELRKRYTEIKRLPVFYYTAEKGLGKWRVTLKHGEQIFVVNYECDTKSNALWLREMLAICLSKIVEDQTKYQTKPKGTK